MKAAVVHGANDIRLEEVPRPFPEPGDIVVRVRASGICATDIKTLLGQGLPKKLPTILGHEVAGEVSALGEGVKDFAAGDRVAVYPIAVCGECDYCTNERPVSYTHLDVYKRQAVPFAVPRPFIVYKDD